MKQIDSLQTDKKFKKTVIGKIPVDWEVRKIEDICDVVGGSTPSTSVKEYWGGEIPWAIPTDITRLNCNVISETEKMITQEGLESCSASILPGGSILLTSRATIGECAINNRPMATNQGFSSLICKENAYNCFLFYSIKARKKELKQLASGNTFKEVSKKSIRLLKIQLPSLPEQKKIAEILSTSDELIEKKVEIIDKKKQLKKELMHQLFTRGIGHTEFKKTEIGEIPVDWGVYSIGKISEIRRGASPHPIGDPKYFGDSAGTSIIKHTKIPLPPLPEQKRIADILSSIDNDIEKELVYKKRLDIIKKGLMQVLLTGRVRVKV